MTAAYPAETLRTHAAALLAAAGLAPDRAATVAAILVQLAGIRHSVPCDVGG